MLFIHEIITVVKLKSVSGNDKKNCCFILVLTPLVWCFFLFLCSVELDDMCSHLYSAHVFSKTVFFYISTLHKIFSKLKNFTQLYSVWHVELTKINRTKNSQCMRIFNTSVVFRLSMLQVSTLTYAQLHKTCTLIHVFIFYFSFEKKKQ